MDTRERIDLQGEAGLAYIARSPYTGSFQGMRYRLNKDMQSAGEGEEKTEIPVLGLTIYPEPLNYEKTPEEQKERSVFPFSEEGFAAAIAYLNQQYQERKGYWEEALRNRFRV